jgi:hypothetical protein
MTAPRHFIKNRSNQGTILLTTFAEMAHENILAKAHAQVALDKALETVSLINGEVNCLNTIALLLSDTPSEPLLRATAQQKGSVLGLAALGYVLTYSGCGEEARQAVVGGEGVILLRVVGELESLSAEVKVFNTWQEYQVFLAPILASGDFVASMNSNFSN